MFMRGGTVVMLCGVLFQSFALVPNQPCACQTSCGAIMPLRKDELMARGYSSALYLSALAELLAPPILGTRRLERTKL